MSAFHQIPGPSDKAFIFCDHASNAVPDWIGDLGVSDADMNRHIAWDIGSEIVGRTLARELECGALICGFSRLVIDANRNPSAANLIPEVSDGTIIPANQNLSREAREERLVRLYNAYHDALGEALDQRPETFAISVHSFTPQLRGEPKRPTDVGLLTKADEASADAFVERMAEVAPHFQVDINLPYSAHELNFTVDHSVVCRGLRHLAIELRQDHISNRNDAEAMGKLLARAIRPLL